MCIRPVMTYASPVFAHAAPNVLCDLQLVQNKIFKGAIDAPWYVKNSTLYRDLELPTIAKFMKDASERFFDSAEKHLNPLLSSAVPYEAPLLLYFIRRLRNVLLDSPDELTAAVEELIEVNNMAKDYRVITRRRHLYDNQAAFDEDVKASGLTAGPYQ